METVDNRTFSEKVRDAKERAKDKLRSAKDWCSNNREVVIAVAPIALGGVIELIKIAARRGNVNTEKDLKEKYIYDRSQGHYYELKRKLKSSEWITIEERKNNGEPLGIILRDMKVLK